MALFIWSCTKIEWIDEFLVQKDFKSIFFSEDQSKFAFQNAFAWKLIEYFFWSTRLW